MSEVGISSVDSPLCSKALSRRTVLLRPIGTGLLVIMEAAWRVVVLRCHLRRLRLLRIGFPSRDFEDKSLEEVLS
jgi:hypothetical protein